MSFVQRLRMANMFPVRSNLGNARIPIKPDIDINSILMQQRNNVSGGNGLQRVSQMNRPSTLEEPLKFGGVVGSQSNPGADILSRARNNAENLWESYKQPLNAPVEGPSNDELHYQRYLDNALKTRKIDSDIAQNERKIGNEEKRLEQADKRINNTETLGDRRLDIAEGNAKLKSDLANDKKLEQDTVRQRIKDNIKTRAQEGLDLIKGLMNDDDGTLNPDTQSATGFTGKFPMLEYMPGGFGESMATGNAKLDRLRDLLTLDVLQELKELSKTGATGMGALNLKELGVLQSAGSLLNKRGMREGEFSSELKRLKGELEKTLMPDRFDLTDGNNSIEQNNNFENNFEILIDPNGIRRRVPKNQVEEFLRQGGRRQ